MKKQLIFLTLIILFSATIKADTVYAAQEYGLLISSYSTFPSSIKPGDKNILLRANITHYGSRTYNNIKLTLIMPNGFEALNNTAHIDKMNKFDKYSVQFKFNSEEIEAGTYIFPIKIEYNDSQGGFVSYTKYITLQVSSTPLLELNSINYNTPYIGEEFEINFSLTNKELTQASNINAKIKLSGLSVSWLPSSKTIKQIPPKSTKTITFKGIVSRNALPKSYLGNITLNYNGNSLTNDFILDISGKPMLKIAGISTSDDVYTGKKTSVSLQLENIGKGDAESVKVTLINSSSQGVKTAYIGKIEYDDTGTAIFDLSFSKKGTNTLTALITYTDDLQKKHSFEKKFNIYVNSEKKNYLNYLIILLIAISLAYYYYKKKKQSEQLKRV